MTLFEAVQLIQDERKRMVNILDNYGWTCHGRDHDFDDVWLDLYTPKGKGKYEEPIMSIDRETLFWQIDREEKTHEGYGFESLHEFLKNNATWTYTR